LLPEVWPAARLLQPISVSGVQEYYLDGSLITRRSGGLFAGKVLSAEQVAPTGGRFDPKSQMGKMYRARYLSEGYLKALEVVKTAAVCPSAIDSLHG
jgi:aflatoxin B1 aldehyde reductase